MEAGKKEGSKIWEQDEERENQRQRKRVTSNDWNDMHMLEAYDKGSKQMKAKQRWDRALVDRKITRINKQTKQANRKETT